MKLLKENLFPIASFGIVLFLSFKNNWSLWSKVLIIVIGCICAIVIYKDYYKSK
jgi:membrane protein YdbS with pleckstrin-like domain